MNFYVHPLGVCESQNIGDKTRVWAFSHVLPSAHIGKECNICNNVFIENDVVVGDRVTVKSGVQLWDGVRIGHDVFIGPNATFTNDRFPRSKQHLSSVLKTRVEDNASIGANATILPGITIGQNAMVGAGAVVTRSVPSHAVVVGNPARIVNYVSSLEQSTPKPTLSSNQKQKSIDKVSFTNLSVAGCMLIEFPHFIDMRGRLTPIEFEDDLPFRPSRSFLVYDVPSKEVRGEHAHHTCHQFLLSINGSCNVVVDDGRTRTEIVLDNPSRGLYLPPMIWGTQYKFTTDAVLLVLASHAYDSQDYIRQYKSFLEAVATLS